ncbi:PspA/IM30 family protein [Pseudomonadota bacterium]
MAVFNRLTRLFRADFHAVIDQLEEPYMLLKHSVREMEEALQQDRNDLKQLQQQQRILDERIKEFDQSIANFDDELNVCFEADNEDLARVLIKRKLECQQLLKSFNTKRSSLVHEVSQVQTRIDEYVPRLESMHQKLELVSEELPHGEIESAGNAMMNSVSDADVEVALLREKQQRSRS